MSVNQPTSIGNRDAGCYGTHLVRSIKESVCLLLETKCKFKKEKRRRKKANVQKGGKIRNANSSVSVNQPTSIHKNGNAGCYGSQWVGSITKSTRLLLETRCKIEKKKAGEMPALRNKGTKEMQIHL